MSHLPLVRVRYGPDKTCQRTVYGERIIASPPLSPSPFSVFADAQCAHTELRNHLRRAAKPSAREGGVRQTASAKFTRGFHQPCDAPGGKGVVFTASPSYGKMVDFSPYSSIMTSSFREISLSREISSFREISWVIGNRVTVQVSHVEQITSDRSRPLDHLDPKLSL